MKKSEVENRFGKSLGKVSAPNFNNKSYTDEWVTYYSFNTGTLDRNDKIFVDKGGFVFDYEFINGDTLYKATRDDIYNLKKCFDEEGVKYKD